MTLGRCGLSGLLCAQVPRIKGHLNEDLHFLLGQEVLPPTAEGERAHNILMRDSRSPRSPPPTAERRGNHLKVLGAFTSKPRPQSGLDYLVCATFAGQRSRQLLNLDMWGLDFTAGILGNLFFVEPISMNWGGIMSIFRILNRI